MNILPSKNPKRKKERKGEQNSEGEILNKRN